MLLDPHTRASRLVASLVSGALILGLAPVAASAAPAERRGALAVVNVTPGAHGADAVESAAQALASFAGGWAREAGIAALLAGRAHSAAPSGDVGKELASVLERLRARQASAKDLADLGRLLGVDYLLLLRVRGQTLAGRLYSVGRGEYSPHGLEARVGDAARLRGYVVEEIRGTSKSQQAKKSRGSRWWIWALALGLGGLTVGLALTAKSSDSGDLRIRISR